MARVLEFQLQHESFQWIFRTDFLLDWMVGSPCSPRDSQESSPTPQFKSINSSALSFLHSPTLTSIHDCWKNIAVRNNESFWIQSYCINSNIMLLHFRSLWRFFVLWYQWHMLKPFQRSSLFSLCTLHKHMCMYAHIYSCTNSHIQFSNVCFSLEKIIWNHKIWVNF